MINHNFPEKIATALAGDAFDKMWYGSIGTDATIVESSGNTGMGAELGRQETVVTSNKGTILFETPFLGSVSAYTGQVVTEVGQFDKSSTGALQMRSTNFSSITVNTNTLYFVDNYVDISEDNNSNTLMLTDAGRDQVIALLAGTSAVYPTYAAFGSLLILDQCDATTGWTATGGAVATSTNFQEGTASLSLTKTTAVSSTVSLVKTISSKNCSSVTYFYLWFRINSLTTFNKLTPTGCLELRVGSDSSNYKKYLWDTTSLATIWDFIDSATATASTVGSPTMSACTYLYLALHTNNVTDVWSGEEILIDFISSDWQMTSADTVLHNEVVRKTIDTVELDVTSVRYTGQLGTSEGNTYNYYYMAIFDAASNGTMYLLNNIVPVSKNSSGQLDFFADISVGLQ